MKYQGYIMISAVIGLILILCGTYLHNVAETGEKPVFVEGTNYITECGTGVISSAAVLAEIEEQYKGVVVRSGNPESKMLTITCNVDWGEEIIPGIMDVLDKEEIKITFFISGKWAEKNPDLLRKIYIRGHEIQSHGYGHKLCSKISVEEVKEEIQKTEKIIENLIGIRTNTFAPPSGDFNDSTVALCKDLGYTLSLWSADTIDWREGSTAQVITERILGKELNGAIVLMHPKKATLEALPGLIHSIKEKGIQIVPLKELLAYSDS